MQIDQANGFGHPRCGTDHNAIRGKSRVQRGQGACNGVLAMGFKMTIKVHRPVNVSFQNVRQARDFQPLKAEII